MNEASAEQLVTQSEDFVERIVNFLAPDDSLNQCLDKVE